MNLNQFTQKSVEAVQAAQQMSSARQNQQIEQEHLLLALLEQKEGLIPQLMQKAGVEPAALRAEAHRRGGASAPGFRQRRRADVPLPRPGAGPERGRKDRP